MAAFIRFHTQDSNGRPIGGAALSATAPNHGPWQVQTNPCGDFYATLGPDVYTVTISAPGYQSRTIPMNLADSGDILIGLESGSGPIGPFVPAPRDYAGNMCGIRENVAAVDGGAADPTLVLSWFYDRYSAADRATIRAGWKRRGELDVLTSWPDSQDWGHSPEEFLAFQQELIADGLRPCVMLSAKPTSSVNTRDLPGTLRNIMLVLPLLVGVVPRFCIGWELSLWLSPSDVQWLTEQVAPVCRRQPGTQVFVHFQEGYMSFPQPDHDNASYWQKQVGLLDGVLAQARQYDPESSILDWIHDCLVRFAGQFNMPVDRGDGTPFDFVLLEISAMLQFNNGMSEAEGDRRGREFKNAPPQSGPAGTVHVRGSGNGF